MDYTLKYIVSELKDYDKQNGKILLDKSLTDIQKKVHLNSIKDTFEKKGIRIISDQYDFNEHNQKKSKRIFLFSSLYIKDTGIITDVSSNGEFPIRISLEDNINVKFEPRNLKIIPLPERQKINNSEFSCLEKGSNYEFHGEISYCYYYNNSETKFFEFAIVGMDSISKSDNLDLIENCTKHPIVYFFITAILLFLSVLFNKINVTGLDALLFIFTAITFVISFIGFTKDVKPVFSYPRSKYLGTKFIEDDPGIVNGGCIGCSMILVLVMIASLLSIIFGIK